MHWRLAGTPFALGLSDLRALTAEQFAINQLRISGIPPTVESIVSGTHLLVGTLAFVFRRD